jgi:hypothetical protein
LAALVRARTSAARASLIEFLHPVSSRIAIAIMINFFTSNGLLFSFLAIILTSLFAGCASKIRTFVHVGGLSHLCGVAKI